MQIVMQFSVKMRANLCTFPLHISVWKCFPTDNCAVCEHDKVCVCVCEWRVLDTRFEQNRCEGMMQHRTYESVHPIFVIVPTPEFILDRNMQIKRKYWIYSWFRRLRLDSGKTIHKQLKLVGYSVVFCFVAFRFDDDNIYETNSE